MITNLNIEDLIYGSQWAADYLSAEIHQGFPKLGVLHDSNIPRLRAFLASYSPEVYDEVARALTRSFEILESASCGENRFSVREIEIVTSYDQFLTLSALKGDFKQIEHAWTSEKAFAALAGLLWKNHGRSLENTGSYWQVSTTLGSTHITGVLTKGGRQRRIGFRLMIETSQSKLRLNVAPLSWCGLSSLTAWWGPLGEIEKFAWFIDTTINDLTQLIQENEPR